MSSFDTTEPASSQPRGRRSPKMMVSLGLGSALAAVLIVVVSILTGGSTATTNALDGQHVSAFDIAALDAGPRVQAPWASGHPTVVVFFASWCGECQSEMPRVATYVSTHALGSVRVLGVDVSDVASAARSFVQRSGIAFPVGVDPTTTISQGEFHLAGMPDTVFVNSNGTVANVVIGAVTNAELSADISAMS